MSNHLGNYLKARREELGLGRSQLARLMGYANLSKGSRRILDTEEGHGCTREFLTTPPTASPDPVAQVRRGGGRWRP